MIKARDNEEKKREHVDISYTREVSLESLVSVHGRGALRERKESNM